MRPESGGINDAGARRLSEIVEARRGVQHGGGQPHAPPPHSELLQDLRRRYCPARAVRHLLPPARRPWHSRGVGQRAHGQTHLVSRWPVPLEQGTGLDASWRMTRSACKEGLQCARRVCSVAITSPCATER